jgi:hypothetical protein
MENGEPKMESMMNRNNAYMEPLAIGRINSGMH